LNKKERQAFRRRMWEFRRDPESLTAEERQALEALFQELPALKEVYQIRRRFQEIFDTVRGYRVRRNVQ
jgi:hypothetical protein